MKKNLLILFLALFSLSGFVFADMAFLDKGFDDEGIVEDKDFKTKNKVIMYRDKIPIEVDYDKGVLIAQGKEIPIIVDGDFEIPSLSKMKEIVWISLDDPPYERFNVYVEEGYYNNNTLEIRDFFDKFKPRYELMESITGWSSEEFYSEKLEIYVEGTDSCAWGWAIPTEAHILLYKNLSDSTVCLNPYYKNGNPYYGNPGELGDQWTYMDTALHESLHSIKPLPISSRSWVREGLSEYYGLNILSNSSFNDINQETANYYLYSGWIIPEWYNWEDYVSNDYHDTTPSENEIQESAGYDITAWMFSMLRDNHSLLWGSFYETMGNNLETLDESYLLGDYYTDTHVIDLFGKACGKNFSEIKEIFEYDGPSGPGWGVREWTDLDWYADLTPVLEVSNTNPTVEENIWLNATIHNNGNVTLNDVTVRFYSNYLDLIDEQVVSVDKNGFTNVVVNEYNASEGEYNISVIVDEDNLKIESNEDNNEDIVPVTFSPTMCGDTNGEGNVTVSDVVYTINYLFKGGNPPHCPFPYRTCADCNGDGDISVSDVVYLINYLFKGGDPPLCNFEEE